MALREPSLGMGIPEYEAKRYEGKVKDGNILLSVHTEDSNERDRAKKILETGARRIFRTLARLRSQRIISSFKCFNQIAGNRDTVDAAELGQQCSLKCPRQLRAPRNISSIEPGPSELWGSDGPVYFDQIRIIY